MIFQKFEDTTTWQQLIDNHSSNCKMLVVEVIETGTLHIAILEGKTVKLLNCRGCIIYNFNSTNKVKNTAKQYKPYGTLDVSDVIAR